MEIKITAKKESTLADMVIFVSLLAVAFSPQLCTSMPFVALFGIIATILPQLQNVARKAASCNCFMVMLHITNAQVPDCEVASHEPCSFSFTSGSSRSPSLVAFLNLHFDG
jgi:hypothetical protein